MKIGIVIPAYNAQNTLFEVVERIGSTTWRQIERVWIIDDGSKDKTQPFAQELSQRHKCIEVVEHSRNRGYGGAMKTGLQNAKQHHIDVVCCLHADGQYAPELIPALVDTLCYRKLDLVQGSRLAAGGALAGGMPLYKYVAGLGLVFLENQVFQLGLSDYHSGYMVYGPAALYGIDFPMLSDSFDFDLEVIACACAHGMAVGEFPIPTRYAEEVSHLRPARYGLRVLGVLGKYYLGQYGKCNAQPAIAPKSQISHEGRER